MAYAEVPMTDHESIERLQEEVDRLKKLLELANVKIAELEKGTLPLLSRMALGGKAARVRGSQSSIGARVIASGRGRPSGRKLAPTVH
jgi:hypothetical protein